MALRISMSLFTQPIGLYNACNSLTGTQKPFQIRAPLTRSLWQFGGGLRRPCQSKLHSIIKEALQPVSEDN